MLAKSHYSVGRLGLITLGIWLVLKFLGFLGLSASLQQRIQTLTQPTQHQLTVMAVTFKLKLWQIGELYQAEQVLQQLRRDQIQLLDQAARLQALEAENQTLRKMIENSDRTLVKTIVAAPIISFAQPALAVGKQAGVTSGMMVTSHNQLLGFVATVANNQATVLLLQSTLSRPVLAKTPSGFTGLIQGDGRQIWLREIPIEQQIKVGELVTTAGQAGVSPGLIVGTVATVKADPVLATQAIQLHQPQNFFELPIVELL